MRKNAQNIKIKINNKIIKPCKKVKYLGIVISSNFSFKKHVDHVINKVNATRSDIIEIIKNKNLKKSIKLLCYKQLVRPIILYACVCWASISSNQMERLRRCERWFLRGITGMYRKVNSNHFINSKKLYENTKTNRIDRKMVERNIDFINKTKQNINNVTSTITETNLNNARDMKYKPLNYIELLHRNGTLYDENQLLIYNKKINRTDSNLIYVTNQNSDRGNCN